LLNFSPSSQELEPTNWVALASATMVPSLKVSLASVSANFRAFLVTEAVTMRGWSITAGRLSLTCIVAVTQGIFSKEVAYAIASSMTVVRIPPWIISFQPWWNLVGVNSALAALPSHSNSSFNPQGLFAAAKAQIAGGNWYLLSSYHLVASLSLPMFTLSNWRSSQVERMQSG